MKTQWFKTNRNSKNHSTKRYNSDGQPDIEMKMMMMVYYIEDDAGTDPKDPDSIPEALQDTGPNDNT